MKCLGDSLTDEPHEAGGAQVKLLRELLQQIERNGKRPQEGANRRRRIPLLHRLYQQPPLQAAIEAQVMPAQRGLLRRIERGILQ